LLGRHPGTLIGLQRSLTRPKEPWKGFVPPIDTFNRGSLISLSLCGHNYELTKKNLDEWDKLTDLSKLQEFTFEVSDPNVLMDIVEKSHFSSLKHLVIKLECRDDNEGFKVAAETFFGTLRPLEVLSVVSLLNTQLLATICTRHGRTLCELALMSCENEFFSAKLPLRFTAADISMIGSSCSVLSNLDITIKRSISNRSETKCYEALSTIPSLKKLHIRLDCRSPTDPGPPSDTWDEFNKTRSTLGFYNGHIEFAIVNFAVDEVLVTSIWDVISENTHNQALESLEITSGGRGLGDQFPCDLHTITNNLCRSYLITASISGDKRKPKVVELTKERREHWDETQRKIEERMLQRCGHRGLSTPCFKVFERLWPLEEGGKNWQEAWCSWPLQRSQ